MPIELKDVVGLDEKIRNLASKDELQKEHKETTRLMITMIGVFASCVALGVAASIFFINSINQSTAVRMDEKFNSMTARMDERFNSIEKKIDSNTTTISKIQADVSVIKSDVSKLDGYIQGMNQKDNKKP